MPDPKLPPIHTIRGQRVVLDSDLAALYGVLTKRLNEEVRRNADRFPEDFCFQLTAEEASFRGRNLRPQKTNPLATTELPRTGRNLRPVQPSVAVAVGTPRH